MHPSSKRNRGFVLPEPLESRRLYAAQIPEDLVNVLHQDIWDVASDAIEHRPNDYVEAGAAKVDGENRVQAYLFGRGSGELPAFAHELEDLGAKVDAIDDVGLHVQAWIPADRVDRAARITGVTELGLPDYLLPNLITSAGDGLLKADKVRSQFPGIDGTGIKIGVISDGANGAASVAAELGTYTINPSLPGNGNEGTAMMEIVHDLAPGAQLYFSGPGTSTDMVSSINYFVAQGCKVIVDDLSFFAEGYFQDTSIATAAQNAVANNNVVYVTSAGNYSDQQHYQAAFTGNVIGFEGGTSRLLNWAGSTTPNNQIKVPDGYTFRAFLQWSDQMGASANDYDFYLLDDSFSVLKQSKSAQTGSQNPYESLLYTNNTGATKTLYLNVNKKPGVANRTIEVFTYNNSSMQYFTAGDALVGHEAIPTVMSVAAENAGSSSVASYSSHGGSTIFTNFASQTSTVRETLDGTAIDGVQTAIGPVWGHPTFYGTSAAAPHAAAIAALVRQANPNLTPAQVVQFMADTAIDFAAYGAGYDTTSGAGLYNALDAVYKAYTPAATDLAAASDSGASSTDNYTNDTTPTFTGTVPAGSFVSLLVNGNVNKTLQLAAGVSSYNITANALAGSVNPYAFTIQVASSNTVPVGNYSFASPALNVTIDTTAPAAPTTPNLAAADDTGVSNSDNITSKPQPTFDLIAEANSTVQILANNVAVGSAASAGSFSISPTNPLAEGSYSITAKATDLAGNVGATSGALNPVQIDTTKPTFSPLVFDPNQSKMTIQVQFNEDVSASLNDGSIVVQNLDTSTNLLPAVQHFAWNLGSGTAKFTFTGLPGQMLADANWKASLAAGNVSDLAGNHPLAGGELEFFFFDADANFDRAVNALDFNAIASNFGLPGKTYSQGDFNYDGQVGTLDFNALAMKFNQSLPSPAPAIPDFAQAPAAATTGSLFNDGAKIESLAGEIL